MGGEGSCCVGVVSIHCRVRHDCNRLLMVCVEDGDGVGESGGDANSRFRFRDGWKSDCEESQANADGSNIIDVVSRNPVINV